MDLAYFVLLVSSLVLVHELGHFTAAKAFGVKVITFSLGFGPKVLRFRGRETEYCVGVLPLGGYVKLLEASKTDIVLPEDRHRTFESLPLHRRVVVVLAGPVMNLLFPVLLYFSVYVTEGPYLPPTVGVVLPGHPAAGRLREGDRIMAIDGEDIGTFDEVKRVVSRSAGRTLRVKVFRDARHVEVEIPVEEKLERRELEMVDRVGSIGVQPRAPAAVIGVREPSSPAYRAGLRTFDVVTHVAGRPVRRWVDLTTILGETSGETIPVSYLRPVVVPDALGGLAEVAVLDAGVVALTPDPAGEDLFERTGLESADLYPAVVPTDSYLYKAGVRPGDRILSLDGELVPAFSTFRERVLGAPDTEHVVQFHSTREGRVRTGTFQLGLAPTPTAPSAALASYARRLQRVQSWVPLAPEPRVDHPSPIPYALSKAVDETIRVTRVILVGMARLIQGRISPTELAGPIAIFEVAGEEGRKGPGYFVWVMAFVSVNLGLLNLLPIPVLDGGHLLFFAIEGALRRPLPLRVREVAHIIGLGVLMALMGFAIRNDMQRRAPGAASEVRP